MKRFLLTTIVTASLLLVCLVSLIVAVAPKAKASTSDQIGNAASASSLGVSNVNATTSNNGATVSLKFKGDANTNYTVSLILDLSRNNFTAPTDGAGNASVAFNSLRSGGSYTFFIRKTVNGQDITSDAYHLISYKPSGNVSNVVIVYTTDRSSAVSFTGNANSPYSLVTRYVTGSRATTDVTTGDNGNGTSPLAGLNSSSSNELSRTFFFQITTAGQPDSDRYSFTLDK